MKVDIFENRINRSVEIVLYDDINGRQFIYYWDGEHWKREEMVEGTVAKPSLTIPVHMFDLIQALEEQGYKMTKQAKFEGELVATKYHLEDLRKLLKLKV